MWNLHDKWRKLLQTKFHLQGLSFLSSLNKLISGWGPDRSNYWLILKGHGFIAKQHNWFYSIIQWLLHSETTTWHVYYHIWRYIVYIYIYTYIRPCSTLKVAKHVRVHYQQWYIYCWSRKPPGDPGICSPPRIRKPCIWSLGKNLPATRGCTSVKIDST